MFSPPGGAFHSPCSGREELSQGDHQVWVLKRQWLFLPATCLIQARLEEDRAEQPGCTGTLPWIQSLYDPSLYVGSNAICQDILNIRIYFWDVLVVLGCCWSYDVRRGCVILGQLWQVCFTCELLTYLEQEMPKRWVAYSKRMNFWEIPNCLWPPIIIFGKSCCKFHPKSPVWRSKIYNIIFL